VLTLLLALALDVPFVPQRADTCGAAALTMVLRYWGVDAAHDEIAAALAEPELRGIRGSKLEAYAQDHGFLAIAHQGDLAHLRGHLGKGRPLIVALDAGKGRFHDVVVVEVEEQGDVLVHDPAEGASRRLSAKDFEKRWAKSGHWTLLVVPR
jgi:ABC-type bacteriocin/lantibiotic exporter with double-glycine peptidase domain